jgi:probable rRNA maturation factor
LRTAAQRAANAVTRTSQAKRPNATLELSVVYGVPRLGLPSASSLRGFASAALSAGLTALKVPNAGLFLIDLRIVDQDEGLALNQSYRGKAYATNVLSFPSGMAVPKRRARSGDPPLHLGDLAVCAPVIAKEAKSGGISLRAHYAHMLVHGVLHLLGFDHEADAAAEAMEGLETQVLASLGFADPYA